MGIEEKLIIFSTKCPNGSYINKVPRVPNLEYVYRLVAKWHDTQQIIIQKDPYPHAMGQSNKIIVEYLLIQYNSIL